jgi:hypothetical protein
VLLGAVALSGCATSSDYRAVTLELRERRSGRPVPEAVIHVRSVSFFEPAGGIIDPSPPRSDEGVTGADGTVRLEVIERHPVELTVVAPGRPPLELDLDLDGDVLPLVLRDDASPELELVIR